jgi:IS30 family transposase
MSELEQRILELRKQGQSYRSIASVLGCSKSTICYHIGDGQKQKNLVRKQMSRTVHPFVRKFDCFKYNTYRQPQPIKKKYMIAIEDY